LNHRSVHDLICNVCVGRMVGTHTLTKRPRSAVQIPMIAKWFETLPKAEKAHAGKFQEALNGLK
jgi:hypothetical protein